MDSAEVVQYIEASSHCCNVKACLTFVALAEAAEQALTRVSPRHAKSSPASSTAKPRAWRER